MMQEYYVISLERCVLTQFTRMDLSRTASMINVELF